MMLCSSRSKVVKKQAVTTVEENGGLGIYNFEAKNKGLSDKWLQKQLLLLRVLDRHNSL